MILALRHHPGGVAIAGPHEIVYDVAAGVASAGPTAVEGEALSWALTDGESDASEAVLVCELQLDPQTQWLMRADRVEFAPGAVAHRHTHPGPGIRRLLHGQITIDSEGRVDTYGPGQAWFERGPDPVLATSSPSEPTAFARVLLLPIAYAGRRTIRYVDPADADKPRAQQATILCEAPVMRA